MGNKSKRYPIDVSFEEVQIHSMDQGTLQFSVTAGGHTLTLKTRHFMCCGRIEDRLSCSCGFHTESANGNGCWQNGHEDGSDFEIDITHRWLIAQALKVATNRGLPNKLGYPAEWDGFWMMATQSVDKVYQIQRVRQQVLPLLATMGYTGEFEVREKPFQLVLKGMTRDQIATMRAAGYRLKPVSGGMSLIKFAPTQDQDLQILIMKANLLFRREIHLITDAALLQML